MVVPETGMATRSSVGKSRLIGLYGVTYD